MRNGPKPLYAAAVVAAGRSMTHVRILVVDDERAIRETLRAGLEAEGWSVTEAADKAQMFAELARSDFDLVTLDLCLAQDDGLTLARELRARWNIPVLMITGKGDPVDRLHGLEQGADDYIVKPFHIGEVILRIRMTLDRYRPHKPPSGAVAYDHSTFDIRSGSVHHADGSVIELTGIEQQLFTLFASNPGRVLSRDDISQALHGRDWSPFDRSIDGHVARLRRKLEPAGEAPVLIRSVRGVGYVFAGEIRPAP